MSNDERVAKLAKELDVDLEYSDKVQNKQSVKPNKTKLQKLAQTIRKELEDASRSTLNTIE